AQAEGSAEQGAAFAAAVAASAGGERVEPTPENVTEGDDHEGEEQQGSAGRVDGRGCGKGRHGEASRGVFWAAWGGAATRDRPVLVLTRPIAGRVALTRPVADKPRPLGGVAAVDRGVDVVGFGALECSAGAFDVYAAYIERADLGRDRLGGDVGVVLG